MDPLAAFALGLVIGGIVIPFLVYVVIIRSVGG